MIVVVVRARPDQRAGVPSRSWPFKRVATQRAPAGARRARGADG